jgi:hypothetical protein
MVVNMKQPYLYSSHSLGYISIQADFLEQLADLVRDECLAQIMVTGLEEAYGMRQVIL